MVEDVITLSDARAQQCWDACDICPRTCPTDGARMCKYVRWFAQPADVRRNAFLRLRLTLAQLFKVLRFQLGYSQLPVTIGQRRRVRRRKRFCRCCNQGALGDELHVLFECPATEAARAPFAHLFPPGCTMLQFVWHQDTFSVVQCILQVLAVVP